MLPFVLIIKKSLADSDASTLEDHVKEATCFYVCVAK